MGQKLGRVNIHAPTYFTCKRLDNGFGLVTQKGFKCLMCPSTLYMKETWSFKCSIFFSLVPKQEVVCGLYNIINKMENYKMFKNIYFFI